MSNKRRTKLVREAEYVAEVEVELTDEDQPWGPYLSPTEVEKLDRVHRCLRRGDVRGATALAKVYRLTPVAS
jgi:hypothetical protein